MNEAAFYMTTQNISYTAIIVAVGVLAAVICAALTAAAVRRSVPAVMVCAGLSMVLAPLCSRALYWYCAPEQFDGIKSMFANMNMGGYCLPGAMIGVLLAAVITNVLKVGDGLLSTLDCIAPGAALGIGIGRLSGFFSNDDKGNYVFTDSAQQKLPMSVPVVDEVTGAVQWRFASFLWEAIAGFVIFAVLLAIAAYCTATDRKLNRGTLFMAFLSLFGAAQAALESTRYDALHMRSNGFISMMQMVALIMLLVPPVYYTVKLFREKRADRSFIPPVVFRWVAVLAMLAGAGVAEYYIQRKGSIALMIYPVQLLLLLLAGLVTWSLARLCGFDSEQQGEYFAEWQRQGESEYYDQDEYNDHDGFEDLRDDQENRYPENYFDEPAQKSSRFVPRRQSDAMWADVDSADDYDEWS